MSATDVTTPVSWVPTPEATQRANVTRLMRAHGIEDLGELHQRSLDHDWFWPAVLGDLGIEFDQPFDQVVDLSDGPARARWFTGGHINAAAACLDRWADSDPQRPAVGWDTEAGDRNDLDYGELTQLADGVAAALSGLGVVKGDTVGIYMPLAPETVAALYGCWKLGAIAVPIFSGFGADALARRLVDSGARVLITADGFRRRGSLVKMKAIAEEALAQAPAVERVLVWRRSRLDAVPWVEGRDVDWADAVPANAKRVTEPVEADHPALLIYTSGSTGKPKGAVLTHAGLLLTIAKDATYHVDLGPDDRLCWITDLGWIMGAWEIVAAGSRGAYACMIEGAPATPPDRVWRLIGEHDISVVGVSPSLIRGLAAAGAEPGPEHDLSSLRIIGATGEPWSPAAYDWLFERVGGGRCPIINISGGSEVGGCILAPTPVQELESCSLGGPALNMDVLVLGEKGEELGPNEVGELAVRGAWPGMTKSLWNDDQRFIETYWSRFDGVWVHGDWASHDERGQWFLHGRSDDTLNIAGQRLGPAEAEAALTALPDVADAAAVAVPHEVKGQAMWCFVVPAGDDVPSEGDLATAVAAALGKPFKPDRVLVVGDLPRTRSQKILRRVVRAIAVGGDTGDLSSLENPGAIELVAEAVKSA